MIYLILAWICSLASAVTLEAAKGRTEFLAVGRPSAIKINGKGTGPTGDLKVKKVDGAYVLNGEAVVDLSTLDTGIGMRDRHMKENYLEVEKFKEAKLKFTDVKVDEKKIKEGGEVAVKATLDLHGKQQPVDVAMTLTPKDDHLTSTSKFKVKLSDFAINVPKYAGITVADEVQVTTETKFPVKALVTAQSEGT